MINLPGKNIDASGMASLILFTKSLKDDLSISSTKYSRKSSTTTDCLSLPFFRPIMKVLSLKMNKM